MKTPHSHAGKNTLSNTGRTARKTAIFNGNSQQKISSKIKLIQGTSEQTSTLASPSGGCKLSKLLSPEGEFQVNRVVKSKLAEVPEKSTFMPPRPEDLLFMSHIRMSLPGYVKLTA